MNIKIIILVIILFALTIYLQQSYAKIYNRNETVLTAPSWTNPQLFKNPNFQNTVKYVALGDSLTVGLGSNSITQTYSFIFAQNLSKNMSISLVNLAFRGATSDDLINLKLDKAVAENPNYISLFIGINDVHNLTTTKKFEDNINYITTVLMKKTPAKIIILNIPYLGSKNLVLFPYNIFFDYKTREFNKILSKIVLEKNLTLIDLYTPTKEIFSKQTNFYSSDNFHPSSDGYMLWGSLLTDIK